MTSIPKIIHQIWIQGYDNLPLRYQHQAKTWQKRNPSWEYRFWDEHSLKTLIRTHCSGLLPVYEAYEEVVPKSDIGRYVLLEAFGGLYVDIDTICVRPIDQYFLEPNKSLYVQVYDNPLCPVELNSLSENLSNAFIACSPAHQIWRLVIRYIRENEHPQHFWILVTGPEMFIDCMKQYLDDHDDVHYFTRANIVTAFYISRHYLRWYSWKNRDVFAIHYNDSARSEWHPPLKEWLWPSQ